MAVNNALKLYRGILVRQRKAAEKTVKPATPTSEEPPSKTDAEEAPPEETQTEEAPPEETQTEEAPPEEAEVTDPKAGKAKGQRKAAEKKA